VKHLHVFLIFIGFLQLASYSAAQTELDSMLSINPDLSGKDKVYNLINISRQFFIANDTSGIAYARQAVDLSEQMNFEEGEGRAYLFLALLYTQRNNDLAIEYYHQSSTILEKTAHPWSAFGYENAAKIYTDRGWYPEALDFYLKALRVYEKSADTTQMAKVMSSIGYLNTKLNEREECIVWQKKALHLINEMKNPEMSGLILGRIGIAWDEMGVFDSAHYYNDRAIKLFSTIEDDYYLSQWYGNKANTYTKQNKFKEAEKYLILARKHQTTKFEKTNQLINFGKVYLETARYQEAKLYLDSALKSAESNKQNRFLADAFFRKYELSLALNNLESALDYYIKFQSIEDSLLNQEKSAQIARMKVRFDTEEKDKALLIEKATNEKLAKEKALAEVAVYNRNMWIILIGGLGLIAILLLLYFSQRARIKARIEKDAAIIEEREKGIEAIFTAQEEERKRIAKDLHDGLGQQISAIKMNFQHLANTFLANNPESDEAAAKIEKMINEAGTDVRSISHQMMPRALTELGLVDALEDMIDKSFTNSAINCNFEHYNIKDRLPQHVEIGLYRIAQELLNNIIKHSKAVSVEVQLMIMGNHCVLIIQDDGQGIDDNSGKKDGIGMMNINNRLRSLKGEINMESDAGKGTTATIRVALN